VSQTGRDGRSLIEAGRKAFQPTTADRERVLSALRARIPTEGGNLGGPSGPAAAPAAKGLAWFGASAAVGLAVVAAVFVSRTPDETPPAPSASVARLGVPAVETTTLRPPAGNVAPQAAPAPTATIGSMAAATPSSVRIPAARPSSDRLAEEVAILSRAESERHAGRLASALTVLEEHRRKFPRGSLAQERMAARIRVLCGLGRVSEAEAELSTLRRASPSSLHLRARAACAAK
jgi:hypothetical protein